MASKTIPSVTPSSTRFFDRRSIKTPLDQFAAELCREAGVRFKGIQSGYDNGKGKVVLAQIMFDNRYGSTLCIALPGATVEAIRGLVSASNEMWERRSLSTNDEEVSA